MVKPHTGTWEKDTKCNDRCFGFLFVCCLFVVCMFVLFVVVVVFRGRGYFYMSNVNVQLIVQPKS